MMTRVKNHEHTYTRKRSLSAVVNQRMNEIMNVSTMYNEINAITYLLILSDLVTTAYTFLLDCSALNIHL